MARSSPPVLLIKRLVYGTLSRTDMYISFDSMSFNYVFVGLIFG